MAGHSVDEYLETIYFLAFPIGEYRPDPNSSAAIASRVAEMLGVSRASAGEMLKRLEADGRLLLAGIMLFHVLFQSQVGIASVEDLAAPAEEDEAAHAGHDHGMGGMGGMGGMPGMM